MKHIIKKIYVDTPHTNTIVGVIDKNKPYTAYITLEGKITPQIDINDPETLKYQIRYRLTQHIQQYLKNYIVIVNMKNDLKANKRSFIKVEVHSNQYHFKDLTPFAIDLNDALNDILSVFKIKISK